MKYPIVEAENLVYIPVSADTEIQEEIARIEAVEKTVGIAKVERIDWCLRRLLRKAHEQLKSGPAELDLEAERVRFLEDHSDETDVDWNDYFERAIAELEVIFAPRP